jgi:hypothetical protein
MQQIGMVLLVEGMGCHADRGAGSFGVTGIDFKTIFVQGSEHAVLGGPRIAAQRPALQHFAQVIAQGQIKAMKHTYCGKGCRVIGATANNNVGLGFEYIQNGLQAHLGNHSSGLLENLFIQGKA